MTVDGTLSSWASDITKYLSSLEMIISKCKKTVHKNALHCSASSSFYQSPWWPKRKKFYHSTFLSIISFHLRAPSLGFSEQKKNNASCGAFLYLWRRLICCKPLASVLEWSACSLSQSRGWRSEHLWLQNLLYEKVDFFFYRFLAVMVTGSKICYEVFFFPCQRFKIVWSLHLQEEVWFQHRQSRFWSGWRKYMGFVKKRDHF